MRRVLSQSRQCTTRMTEIHEDAAPLMEEEMIVESRHCGSLSWMICIFLAFPCIAFCPVDGVSVRAVRRHTEEPRF